MKLGMKSQALAEAVGISYGHLMALVRAKKVKPRLRDSSGHFWWDGRDIALVRRAVATDRRRKEHKRESLCAH
jgi:hypothetical protein